MSSALVEGRLPLTPYRQNAYCDILTRCHGQRLTRTAGEQRWPAMENLANASFGQKALVPTVRDHGIHLSSHATKQRFHFWNLPVLVTSPSRVIRKILDKSPLLQKTWLLKTRKGPRNAALLRNPEKHDGQLHHGVLGGIMGEKQEPGKN